MTNDNDKQVSASASKSFIKKPKPKLIAPLEGTTINRHHLNFFYYLSCKPMKPMI